MSRDTEPTNILDGPEQRITDYRLEEMKQDIAEIKREVKETRKIVGRMVVQRCEPAHRERTLLFANQKWLTLAIIGAYCFLATIAGFMIGNAKAKDISNDTTTQIERIADRSNNPIHSIDNDGMFGKSEH